MTKIKKLVDEIADELDSAKEYAENHLMCKAEGNDEWSKRYYEMAEDELKHANYLHDKAVEEIDKAVFALYQFEPEEIDHIINPK